MYLLTAVALHGSLKAWDPESVTTARLDSPETARLLTRILMMPRSAGWDGTANTCLTKGNLARHGSYFLSEQ